MSHRLRGLLGIATTWGIAFSAFATSILLGGLAVGFFPSSIFGPQQIIGVGIQNFFMGGIAGGLFAMLFAGAEGKRTLETVKLSRVALWGFVGVAIPMALVTVGARALYGIPLSAVALGTLTAGIMGSAMSTATIKLARRAPPLGSGGADLVSSGEVEP